MNKTKLLFFQWHSFMNEGIEHALKKLDMEYDTFFYQFDNWEQDEVFSQKFREKIIGGNYAKVLSVNFSPLISEICQKYSRWFSDGKKRIGIPVGAGDHGKTCMPRRSFI